MAEVSPRDVAAYRFVHMARSSSVRHYLDAALHPLHMQTLMEVDQLATAMVMVRAGLGVNMMPALTLFHFAQRGIVTRPLRTRGAACAGRHARRCPRHRRLHVWRG